MIQLLTLPKYYVDKHGVEKVSEITGKAAGMVAAWAENKTTIPMKDLQALLDFDPSPIHEIKPLYTLPDNSEKLAFMMPTSRGPHWATFLSTLATWETGKMVPLIEPGSFIVRARNRLAHRWLFHTKCPLGLWGDDDMLWPHGDAASFKSIDGNADYPDFWAGINALHRLLFQKKSLIGAAYFGRRPGASGQFGGSGDPMIDQEIRSGPRDALLKTPWVGFGFVLMQRQVMLDIIEQGLAHEMSDADAHYLGYKYDFFSPQVPGESEDVAFCRLAEKAGHSTYVDLSIMAGHVGSHVFNYKNTR